MYTAEVKTEDKVATQLPEPKGYKLLIGIPEVSEKTEGGIFMPDVEAQKKPLLPLVLS